MGVVFIFISSVFNHFTSSHMCQLVLQQLHHQKENRRPLLIKDNMCVDMIISQYTNENEQKTSPLIIILSDKLLLNIENTAPCKKCLQHIQHCR